MHFDQFHTIFSFMNFL